MAGIFRNTVLKAFLITALFGAAIYAQYKKPDSIWVQVTYYDFHSDGSNPEFECDHSSGVHPDMASVVLPQDNKPALGTVPYLNNYFKYWYRDWKSMAQGDFTKPNYVKTSGGAFDAVINYAGPVAVDHDTSFKNVVIKDSLLFRLQPDGMYKYSNQNFFPLDNRGFGAEGKNHNFSFTMELLIEFKKNKEGMQFQFTGDDDVWAYINHRRVMDLGGIHSAQTGTYTLDSSIKEGETCEFAFFYAERHTTASTIEITTNFLYPVPDTLFITANPNTTVPVYTPVILESHVIDNEKLPRPEVAEKTNWKIIRTLFNPDTILKNKSGDSTILKPIIAYDSIDVEGIIVYKDPLTGDTISLKDTIRIIVTPGPPHKLWIEGGVVNANDWSATNTALRHPNELQSLTIDSSGDTVYAYAIIRDSSGAYVSLATQANWSASLSEGKSIVNAAGETNALYHGIITRVQTGSTQVTARQGTLLPDSVLVKVADYNYVEFRLVERGVGNVITNYVTSISMNTDQSKTYDVYGLKSNMVADSNKAEAWELANAKWVLSSPLDSALTLPNYSSNWVYSPVKPGDGTLTLTNPDDNNTKPLRVPVHIDIAPPSKAEFEITGTKIAGDTLIGIVKIFNTDGLVPGQYCFGTGGKDPSQTTYQDNLGLGGSRQPPPITVIDGVQQNLNPLETGTTYKNDQCFFNGVDTIKIVLYYAPHNNDSLHQLTAILNSTLKAQTDKFKLSPGPVDSIVIVDYDHKAIVDPIILQAPSGDIRLYNDGFDRFGNYINPQNVNWNTTGTLDSINVVSANYKVETVNVTDNQEGTICIWMLSGYDSRRISDCNPLKIIGLAPQLSEATTRDVNGNGFLDRIDMTFMKPLTLSIADTAGFTVSKGNTKFKVDDIIQLGDPTRYTLVLKESGTGPQTDWLPTVTISGLASAANASMVCKDGAAPVVWSVTKDTKKTQVLKDDELIIELSEKIYQAFPQGAFESKNVPNKVFNVWLYNQSTKTYTNVPLLDNIVDFSAVSGKTVTIKLTNGSDINNNHWINIKWEDSIVVDEKTNFPDVMNQKVQVNVLEPPIDMIVGPNPITAGFRYVPRGVIPLTHNVEHLNWAKEMGVAIQVNLTLPNDGTKVYGYLKVYDAVGNVVYYSPKYDVIDDLTKQNYDFKNSSTFSLLLYWPGCNIEGMRVAPGVYKMVFFVDYESAKYADTKLYKIIGVKR